LFPCNHQIFDERDPLEQSQRNITSCFFENPVHCTSISEEPSNTSGAIPQTLTKTVTPCASQNTTVVVVVQPTDISPVPDTFGRKQEQPRKQHSRTGSAAILTSSPYKNILQENLKKKETGDRRKSSSKIRLQKKSQSGRSDGSVSVVRGEHEMKEKQTASEPSSSDSKDCEESILIETDEECSDCDGECCLCSSGLYPEKGAAKGGPNAQNAASGAMKCVQVQKTGKGFSSFSTT
jgi:hypothetical protein